MEFPKWPSSGGGTFVKFDQEPVIGVVRGDFVFLQRHFVNKKSLTCPGADSCELCQTGKKDDRAQSKFRVNFVQYENGAYASKILEGGKRLYEALQGVGKRVLLNKNAIEIERTGKDSQTQYQVFLVQNGAVTAEIEAKISKLQLLDLSDRTEDEDAA